MGDTLLNKGASLQNLKSYEEAIGTLEKLISLKGDIPNAFYFLGLVYSKSNQMQPALENYNEAIRLDRENKNYYRARADVYKALGDSKMTNADLDRLKNESDEYRD